MGERGGGCVIVGQRVRKKKNMYDTWYSQAVTHPSTDQARRCLTSVIGREPVLSTWCGRTQCMFGTKSIKAIKLYLSFIFKSPFYYVNF